MITATKTAKSYPKQAIYVNRNASRSGAVLSKNFVRIPTVGFFDGGGDRKDGKTFLFSDSEQDALLREIRLETARIRNRNAGKS